jgi:lysophospholipase L1-like esterase
MPIYPFKRLLPLGGKGGASWSSYWATRNAYFALPATGVSLMVGQEVTIYGDTLIAIPIDNPLVVEYTCDIGTQVGNNLVITPEVGDVGDHSLRMVFKNGGYTIEDKTITLTVYAEAALGTKNVLTIGDSLTGAAMGNNWYQPIIAATMSGVTLTYWGLKGGIYPNEGHAGATWSRFVLNNQPIVDPSPFFKEGVLNVPAYFVDNSIPAPDFVVIMLGVNDLTGSSLITGDGLTAGEITSVINLAKTLIDELLDYDAGTRILLGIPTSVDNETASWEGLYDDALYSKNMFIDNIHKYWVTFIETFANGVYNTRVDCAYLPIFLDRANYDNPIHPDQPGYEQLALGIAMKLNENIVQDAVQLSLESRGTGVGVSTLRMTTTCPQTLTLSGAARFYSDSGGTADESTTWTPTVGSLQTIYVKCTTGTATLTIPKARHITEWGDASNIGWNISANAPWIVDSISKLPKLTKLNLSGNCALTGTLSSTLQYLKSDLSSGATCNFSGGLPSTLTYCYLVNSGNTMIITGALPTGLTFLHLYSNNISWTYSGALNDDMTYIYLRSSAINWTGLSIGDGANITNLTLYD